MPQPITLVRGGRTVTSDATPFASFCGPCEAEKIQAASAAIRNRQNRPSPFAALPPITDPAQEQVSTPAEPQRAPDDGTLARWSGTLAVEGELTGDGRYIEPGALHWDALPMPLRWDIEDDGEHAGAVVVGLIEHIERTPDNRIVGYGFIDLVGDNGWNAARLMDRGMLRGISIDPDDVDFEIRVAKDLYDSVMSEVEMLSEEEMALAPAPPELPVDADGRVTVHTVRSDDEVMVLMDGRIRAATLVDTPAFANAQINLDAALPERPTSSVPSGSGIALVAAATPVRPPSSWFRDPELQRPTPLTVTEEGRIFGHLAPWDSCHTGFRSCVRPPRSRTNYAWFRTGVLITDDGEEVAVGRISLDTGHAGPTLSAHASVAHYDNTGFAAADIAAGEDTHGIWVAGAVRPSVTEEQRRVLRSSPLSGDWRTIGGNLELCAVLAVNMPGFPVPRGLVASGRPQSLILGATGDAEPEQLTPDELAELRSLVASGRAQRRDEADILATEIRQRQARALARMMGR